MEYIPRLIETVLLQALEDQTPPFNVILLKGARQCGKSTLLTHLFPPSEHIHINLAKEAGFAEEIDRTTSFEDFSYLIEARWGYKIGGSRLLIFDEPISGLRVASLGLIVVGVVGLQLSGAVH